ncbi:MAG TPA: sodium:solute symporter family protein [Candidatus Hydrothermia bacterium]|nr:sodium:solute symporter family protein [Candidatus Hydrothermia bacterium]HOL23584.1 sodium:solute symporter family protein [Candidatus Hydrothermia bacterium]HOP32316.1 sodium:solute symporter family protein [Candidatus Hydrothermia bacterium]HPO78590.1 sodium:solute symporter family protein [Candidatus Hydrothermia bacterium]
MQFTVQFFIVLAYFVIVLVVGILAQKLAKSGTDYLIAGRNLGLWLCTVVVVGEWLGGMSTIGVSERAYVSGISSAWYNVSTSIGMALFGFLLAKYYRKHQVFTVSEMIEKLYDKNTRIISSFAFLIAYIILGYAQIQTVGSVLASTLNISFKSGVIIGGLLVTIYVTAGGFWSITLTNVIHTFLLYFAIISTFIIGLVKIGGYSGLFTALAEAGKDLVVYKSPVGVGLNQVIGWIIGGVFGAFAAQASIQPVFAARDEKTAKQASLLSALLILPTGIITATLGMIAATGKFASIPDPKQALPSLLMSSDFVPPWFGGIAIAGVLAAILSTIGPVMFAISTILVKDIYQYLINKEADEKKLLKVSRWFTFIVGLLLIPLAAYMQGFVLDTGYISYAIRGAAAIIVLAGVFWVSKGRRVTTSLAATIALIGGTVISVLFPIISYYNPEFKFDKNVWALGSAIVLLLLVTLVERLLFKKREV